MWGENGFKFNGKRLQTQETVEKCLCNKVLNDPIEYIIKTAICQMKTGPVVPALWLLFVDHGSNGLTFVKRWNSNVG